jgi:enoyl-CoA hydratase
MTVEVERRGRVGLVTLNRPERRNAFDAEQTKLLDAALNELDDDRSVRVIVLAATGPAFCAGTDLTRGAGGRTGRGGFYGITDRRRSTPIIAVTEGPAVGGGFEVILACDLVVASTNATFALPEVSRGLIATCGGLFRTHRALSPTLAAELLLTGDSIDAERAHAMGLVNRLTAPGEALSEAFRLADRICRNSPSAVAATVQSMRAVDGALDYVGWSATEHAAQVTLASPDAREGRKAFFEKRAPDWS